jgi:hypothetical protein
MSRSVLKRMAELRPCTAMARISIPKKTGAINEGHVIEQAGLVYIILQANRWRAFEDGPTHAHPTSM